MCGRTKSKIQKLRAYRGPAVSDVLDPFGILERQQRVRSEVDRMESLETRQYCLQLGQAGVLYRARAVKGQAQVSAIGVQQGEGALTSGPTRSSYFHGPGSLARYRMFKTWS